MDDLHATYAGEINEQVIKYCNKSECFVPPEDFDECTTGLSSMVKCYKQIALDVLAVCALQIACENWYQEYQSCVEDKLGIGQ